MKKKVTITILGVLIVLVGLLGYTYALWTYNTSQTTNNILKSGCFKLELTEEQNNINLQNIIPLTNSEGMELTPYTFKVENTCTTAASYEVNLESLASSTLDSSFVRLSLNSQEPKLLTEYELNSSTIIDNAKEGRKLDTGVLEAGKSKSYSLRVWLDGNTTATSTVLDRTFNSKVTISGTLNPNYITINLDPNGGFIATTSKDVIIGDKYRDLPSPTKDGYYFNYWYLDSDENKITSNTTIERKAAHTLKASWIDANEVTLLKENAFKDLTDYKETTTEIKPYTGELTEDIKTNAVVISDDTSHNKAYAWLDNTTLYYAGETNNIYMQNDLFGYVYNDYSSKGYMAAKSIDLSMINTSLVTSMKNFFYNCFSLTTINLTNLNTTNVTDMDNMFWCCNYLTSLNLASFDTSNVTSMEHMFSNLGRIKNLDLSNFNTSKVTNMWSMFAFCGGLTSLNISSFNTSNVTAMNFMFYGCQKLVYLYLSNFDTSNVTNMSYMFSGCKKISSLDLSKFNTSKVTDMSCMFSGCDNLVSINLTNFNTSNVTNMYGMFAVDTNLKSLDLSDFDTSKVENMSQMFENDNSLVTLDISNFDTSNVNYEKLDKIFYNCGALTQIIINCNKSTSLNSYISNNYSNITVSCI